jgi:hypothetical protein
MGGHIWTFSKDWMKRFAAAIPSVAEPAGATHPAPDVGMPGPDQQNQQALR